MPRAPIGSADRAWLPLAALALALAAACRSSGGPEPIAWDRQACDFCHMHIGEPGFAAELILENGRTLAFDDPGCLFLYEEREHPRVRQAWFHHATEDRWLARDEVAFVTAPTSPMGYGLAAVSKAEGSLTHAQARDRVIASRTARGHP